MSPLLWHLDAVLGSGRPFHYGEVKTLLECLAQLCEKGLATLKQGTTLEALQAKSKTDLAAAQEMQRAKSGLFARFVKQKRRA